MRAVILNAGPGAWAFEELAQNLSRLLGVAVSETPADYNYLLAWDESQPPIGRLFIPWEAIQLAADKRLQARLFPEHRVAIPRTLLLDTLAEVDVILREQPASEWVLKWPTGCAAGGHRFLRLGDVIPAGWPRPYVVQEFIRMDAPEVYRLYAAGGELFGFNVRGFPAGVASSPWVAHARGARYADAGTPPPAAVAEARKALVAAGLLDAFGCADLLHAPDGRWLVLEIGTDGVCNHVDRDVGIATLAEELKRRLADAFRAFQTRDRGGA